MFTLLVSWLLVAGIPGLLMLATLGLGRLEKALVQDTVSPTDVTDFLEQAQAVDMHTLAREGMPEALDYLHRRQAKRHTDAPSPASRGGAAHAEPYFAAHLAGSTEASLPTRAHSHSRTNPQFPTTRHVNRV